MEKIVAFITFVVVTIALLIPFSGIIDISKLALHDWASYFSGVTAPLAFLWLIVGYYIQKKELINNTDALKLQYKELKHTTEQHQESVALQKIELAHRYTMNINIDNANSDVYRPDKSIQMGMMVHNHGHELRKFRLMTSPEISFIGGNELDIFQVNEARRFNWIEKDSTEFFDRIIVTVEYTDIAELHTGQSSFTLIKGTGESYNVVRGKYS